jgi:hypothetical protein
MITDWQLPGLPAPGQDEPEERSPVLLRLLEEAERGEEQNEASAECRAPPDGPPRPFADD